MYSNIALAFLLLLQCSARPSHNRMRSKRSRPTYLKLMGVLKNPTTKICLRFSPGSAARQQTNYLTSFSLFFSKARSRRQHLIKSHCWHSILGPSLNCFPYLMSYSDYFPGKKERTEKKVSRLVTKEKKKVYGRRHVVEEDKEEAATLGRSRQRFSLFFRRSIDRS